MPKGKAPIEAQTRYSGSTKVIVSHEQGLRMVRSLFTLVRRKLPLHSCVVLDNVYNTLFSVDSKIQRLTVQQPTSEQ